MTAPALDRRALLRLLASLSVGVSASPLFALQTQGSARATEGLSDDALLGFRDLGREYEKEHPSDTKAIDELAQRLTDASLDDPGGAEALRAEMRDDYAQRRVVELLGWQVSRTEGRLCAAIHRLNA